MTVYLCICVAPCFRERFILPTSFLHKIKSYKRFHQINKICYLTQTTIVIITSGIPNVFLCCYHPFIRFFNSFNVSSKIEGSPTSTAETEPSSVLMRILQQPEFEDVTEENGKAHVFFKTVLKIRLRFTCIMISKIYFI